MSELEELLAAVGPCILVKNPPVNTWAKSIAGKWAAARVEGDYLSMGNSFIDDGSVRFFFADTPEEALQAVLRYWTQRQELDGAK